MTCGKCVLVIAVALSLHPACGEKQTTSAKGPGAYPAMLKAAPEAVREGVVLPVAGSAVEEWPDVRFLEIVATRDRAVWINGVSGERMWTVPPLSTLDLPREKHHLKRVSLQPILITAHEDLPWGFVNELIQMCFGACLPRVHLAVRRFPDRPDTALLPTCFPWLEDEDLRFTPIDYADTGSSLSVVREGGEVAVAVTNSLGEPLTDGPAPLPIGAPGLPTLLKGLATPARKLKGQAVPWRMVQLGAEPLVEYRHVVFLADACRRAGFDRIMFRFDDLYRYGANILDILDAMPSGLREEMQLPVCGLENEEPPDEFNVELGLLRDGRTLRWGRDVEARALRSELYKNAETKRSLDDPAKPSANAVVIIADARVPWRQVRTVMMTCADSIVRIYRIYWATVTPEGSERRIAVHLPRSTEDVDETPEVWIQVDPGAQEGEMRLRLDRRDIGCGKDGLAKLGALMKTRRGVSPDFAATVTCAADLPFGDVVKVVETVRMAGVTDVHFTEY